MFKLKIILALLIFAVTIISLIQPTLACFNPKDKGSIEVVLNKPGIHYDISLLKKTNNIVLVKYSLEKEAFLYRSHVNPNVIVIVSQQSIIPKENAVTYITVRVESIFNKSTILENICSGPATINDKVTVLKDVAENFGWNVEIANSNNSFKGYLDKNIGYAKARIYLAYLSTNRTHVEVIIENANSEAKVEVRNVLEKAFKPPLTINLKCIAKNYVYEEPLANEKELKNSLKYELKWLIEIGVIKGLDDEAVNEIISSAKIGYAGWNSRLVYYNGKWLPYHEVAEYIPEASLIKSLTSCSWSFHPEELPKEPPPIVVTYTATGNNLSKLLDARALLIFIVPLLIALIFYRFLKAKMSNH